MSYLYVDLVWDALVYPRNISVSEVRLFYQVFIVLIPLILFAIAQGIIFIVIGALNKQFHGFLFIISGALYLVYISISIMILWQLDPLSPTPLGTIIIIISYIGNGCLLGSQILFLTYSIKNRNKFLVISSLLFLASIIFLIFFPLGLIVNINGGF